MNANNQHTECTANLLDNMEADELRDMLAEMAAQMDKTVRQLEHATKALASIGTEAGMYLGWLRDIRQAAGQTAPGTSHSDLVASIRAMNQRQMNGATH